MDLQERVQLVKKELISILVKYKIDINIAIKYADDNANQLIENINLVKKSLKDIKNIIDLSIYELIIKDIKQAINPYVLNFDEIAHLELEKDNSEINQEEAEKRKEDILALIEIENFCNSHKRCDVTTEQKNLIQVLIEGLDPERFKNHFVSQEEISNFTKYAKIFGIPQPLIDYYISQNTSEHIKSFVNEIISKENIINNKRNKILSFIKSNLSRGTFKFEEVLKNKFRTRY